MSNPNSQSPTCLLSNPCQHCFDFSNTILAKLPPLLLTLHDSHPLTHLNLFDHQPRPLPLSISPNHFSVGVLNYAQIQNSIQSFLIFCNSISHFFAFFSSSRFAVAFEFAFCPNLNVNRIEISFLFHFTNSWSFFYSSTKFGLIVGSQSCSNLNQTDLCLLLLSPPVFKMLDVTVISERIIFAIKQQIQYYHPQRAATCIQSYKVNSIRSRSNPINQTHNNQTILYQMWCQIRKILGILSKSQVSQRMIDVGILNENF